MLESIKLDTILDILNGYEKGCQDDELRPSKDWVRNHLDRLGERPISTGITGTRVSLDKNTLKWRAWTSSGVPSVPSEGVQDENAFDQPFYKLTANDYRKLNNQIRETSSAPVVRKNTTTFKRYYHPRSGDNVTKLYRSQLASSLKAFDDKKWPSYENGADSVTSYRSRPGSSLSDTRQTQSRPGSSRLSLLSKERARPQSSPAAQRLPSACSQTSPPEDPLSVRSLSAGGGKQPPSYDRLTPDVVYELSAGPRPESVYGDRSESALARLDELDEEAKDGESSSAGRSEELRPEVCTAEAGTQAGGRSDPDEPTGDEGGPEIADGNMSDRDTDLDSDEEDYPEPPVEWMNLSDLPNLALRPEKMDALDVPVYARGDRRKYDFDASNVEHPVCEFADPLPRRLESVSVRDMSQSERDWREQTRARPGDPGEEYIVDRLIEFERLQARTVEWEVARQERARAVRQRQARSKVYPQCRAQSAKTWREKKCCADCTQPACVGDCPGKPPAGSAQCPACSERHCSGNCGRTVYESRSRGEWVDDDRPKAARCRPRSCATCQQRHGGGARLISASSLALGRPKSGAAALTRGQNGLRPRDVRGKSAGGGGVPKDLQIELENMALDPDAPERLDREAESVSRPGTAGSIPRRPGRAGVIPGKSFFSQRRVSLTDKDPSMERAKPLSNKRIKSSRRRRPNTAAL